MKNKGSSKEESSPPSPPPRALYHVYQKLNYLRELIAEGGYPNAATLAERMEISLRTAKRYLDNLRECGAPLENDRKRGGYHSRIYGNSRISRSGEPPAQ